MHKIDGKNATEDGQFREYDPSTGAGATYVTAEWLNTVQGELMAFLEGRGVDPNKDDSAQVYKIVLDMFQGGLTGGAPVYASTTQGLSATPEGGYFSVPSGEPGESLILYRHDSGGVATEVARTPSSYGVLTAEVVAVAASEAAETQADRSEVEADRSEAARDAAQLSAGVFPDTAAGLAGTSDGDYFSVPDDNEDDFLTLYRNDSGSSVVVDAYPSAAAVRKRPLAVPDIAAIRALTGVQDGQVVYAASDGSGGAGSYKIISSSLSENLPNVVVLNSGLRAIKDPTLAQAKAYTDTAEAQARHYTDAQLTSFAEGAAGVFADTAAGLAGTAEGDYFNVPSGEPTEIYIVYRHDAGPVATEFGRTLSAGAITERDERARHSIDSPNLVPYSEASFLDNSLWDGTMTMEASSAGGVPAWEMVCGGGTQQYMTRYFDAGDFADTGTVTMKVQALDSADSTSNCYLDIRQLDSGGSLVAGTNYIVQIAAASGITTPEIFGEIGFPIDPSAEQVRVRVYVNADAGVARSIFIREMLVSSGSSGVYLPPKEKSITRPELMESLPKDYKIWHPSNTFNLGRLDQLVLSASVEGADPDIIYGVGNVRFGDSRRFIGIYEYSSSGVRGDRVALFDTGSTPPPANESGQLETVFLEEEDSSGVTATLTVDWSALEGEGPDGTEDYWHYSSVALNDGRLSVFGSGAPGVIGYGHGIYEFTIDGVDARLVTSDGYGNGVPDTLLIIAHGNGSNYRYDPSPGFQAWARANKVSYACISGQDYTGAPYGSTASGWGGDIHRARYQQLYNYLQGRFSFHKSVVMAGASMGGLVMGQLAYYQPFPIAFCLGVGPVPSLKYIFENGGETRKSPIRNAFEMASDGSDDADIDDFISGYDWFDMGLSPDNSAKYGFPRMHLYAGVDATYTGEFGGATNYPLIRDRLRSAGGFCRLTILPGVAHAADAIWDQVLTDGVFEQELLGLS